MPPSPSQVQATAGSALSHGDSYFPNGVPISRPFFEFCARVVSIDHHKRFGLSTEQQRQVLDQSSGILQQDIPTAPNRVGNPLQDQHGSSSQPMSDGRQVGQTADAPVDRSVVGQICEVLSNLRQTDDMPIRLQRFLKNPLPDVERPCVFKDVQTVPEQLYHYVEVLTLTLAAEDAILGIWVDMWNALQIHISFPVLCAMCQKMVSKNPGDLKVNPSIPIHDQVPLKWAMAQKLRGNVMALHGWAVSENGLQMRQKVARMMKEEYNLECTAMLVSDLGIWNELGPAQ